jgi:hypothetical protein
MDEKSLIFGVSYAVDDLIMALLKQNIDLNVEEDYYVNISPPPIPDSTDFGDSVISGIFVDLTEDVVKAILGWFREQKKEHMKNPKLKISISGNLFNVNAHDMEIIRDVLKECSKTKKGTK